MTTTDVRAFRSRLTQPTGSPAAEVSGPHDQQVSWVWWARIGAAVAVVTIHVTSHLVFAWGETSARLWHVGNLAQSGTRWSVPVFVMVSGALLLRARPGEPSQRFLRRRAVRIGIPVVVWTGFFLWFDAVLTDTPLSAYHFAQGFLWGQPYYHLYFLYVIAGLSLITPFLRVFLHAASGRLRLAAVVVAFGLAFANQLQHWWLGGGGYNAFSFFLPWIGYYLLGGLLTSVRIRRVHARWALAVFAGATATTALGTWWLFGTLGPQQGRLLYDYTAPTTVAAAVAVVVFLRGRCAEPTAAAREVDRAPLVRHLAGLTFGVYVMHPIPLELFVRRSQPGLIEGAADWLQVAAHLGVIAGLIIGCGLVTWVMRRVPALRRLV